MKTIEYIGVKYTPASFLKALLDQRFKELPPKHLVLDAIEHFKHTIDEVYEREKMNKG